MKVFICWSGDRSKVIAKALRSFIPEVIQQVKCFMSEADIDAGARWADQLLEELETTEFGIPCLTPENVTAPWINYETGSLAKSVSSGRVCPYLIDMSMGDVPWPLAQFQAKRCDSEGTKSILYSINSCLDSPLEKDMLERSFSKAWPDFEQVLRNIGNSKNNRGKREVRDMLEEILWLLRPKSERKAASAVPKALVVEAVGGFLDGQRLFSDTKSNAPGHPLDPKGFYHLTDNGQVGRRLRTATKKALDAMLGARNESELRARVDELPDEEKSQVYQVVDRFESDLLVYMRIEYVPPGRERD